MTFAKGKGRGSKYGAAHKTERARRLKTSTPSTPCSCPGQGLGGCKHHTGPCGKPLGPNTTEWHLPHNTAGTAYLPGMWCGPCNRSEAASRGARKANALARQTAGTGACSNCGKPFVRRGRAQRFCSKACHEALMARKQQPRPKPVKRVAKGKPERSPVLPPRTDAPRALRDW